MSPNGDTGDDATLRLHGPQCYLSVAFMEMTTSGGTGDLVKAFTVFDLATIARARRRDLGFSQAKVAEIVGVSRKWVYEFEGGKPAAELGIVMRTLDALGLEIDIVDPAKNPRAKSQVDLDEILAEHTRHD
jgi:HTH-type transcriptional regulator / antitoxin HipB